MLNKFDIAKIKLLTDGELSVGKLLAQGKTNKDIAKELGLGIGTIKNYVSRLIHKLETPNRVGAAILIFEFQQTDIPN